MPPHERPNVLLITTDTQRVDTLRCMGHDHAISPNLDRLADEGVLFEEAHTSSPVCNPARMSLMTGLHTPIHRTIENGMESRSDLPVITDTLGAAGYTTIMAGKTHFGPYEDTFDSYATPDGWYDEYLGEHGYAEPPEITPFEPNPIPGDLYIDAAIVDRTIEELEATTGAGEPFFAFCSLPSPHQPYAPPGEWQSAYDDVSLPEINYRPGELREQPSQWKRLLGFGEKRDPELEDAVGNYGLEEDTIGELEHNLETEDGREAVDAYRRQYYGLASYCDEQVGRLLEYLDRTGLRESTLVVFSSDHGTQLYDHGFDDKHNYYDGSWRVPFIMSMPGTLPSGERREFAIWNDIATTVLGAAGRQSRTMQGFDLFSPIRDGEPSPRNCAVGTLYRSAAVATSRWKLEYYFADREGRLFDRVADPAEQHDLFDDPDHEAVRDDLLRALLSWRCDIMDLDYYHDAVGGGGPVAGRQAHFTEAMCGVDSERRLNADIAEIASDG